MDDLAVIKADIKDLTRRLLELEKSFTNHKISVADILKSIEERLEKLEQ